MRWFETEGKGLRAALAWLAAVDSPIIAYLTWVYLAGIEPICVFGNEGCLTVQSSRYAAILAVPVRYWAWRATLGCCSRRRGEVRQAPISVCCWP